MNSGHFGAKASRSLQEPREALGPWSPASKASRSLAAPFHPAATPTLQIAENFFYGSW